MPLAQVAILSVVTGAVVGLAAYGLVWVDTQMPTNTPDSCPCGTAFAWGPASNVTSNASPSAGCAAHLECYYLEVGSAGSGVTGSDLSFVLRSSTGAVIPISGWTFTLVSVAGAATTAVWSGTGDCQGAACAGTLQSGQDVAMDTGGTASLLGDNVIGVGYGSFQGEVSTVGGLPR
jgi:hypothetical protein